MERGNLCFELAHSTRVRHGVFFTGPDQSKKLGDVGFPGFENFVMLFFAVVGLVWQRDTALVQVEHVLT